MRMKCKFSGHVWNYQGQSKYYVTVETVAQKKKAD